MKAQIDWCQETKKEICIYANIINDEQYGSNQFFNWTAQQTVLWQLVVHSEKKRDWMSTSPHVEVNWRQIFIPSVRFVSKSDPYRRLQVQRHRVVVGRIRFTFGLRSASFVGCVCPSGLIMLALSIWQPASSQFAKEREPASIPARRTPQDL